MHVELVLTLIFQTALHVLLACMIDLIDQTEQQITRPPAPCLQGRAYAVPVSGCWPPRIR